MSIKRINFESHPLSDYIIENGNYPFKLWLEFEISEPWDDIENDFANISVDTLDGRCYGINVWTFNFLRTAHEEEVENGNSNYVTPPDLFVKELSRTCIEKTIKTLLNEQCPLEETLNNSVFNLNFLEPYVDAFDMEDHTIQSLLDELKIELPDNHILKNKPVELIAKKNTNDDIILKLENGSIAVVHLTWSSKKELGSYPTTRIYKDDIEFWNKEMKADIIDSSNS